MDDTRKLKGFMFSFETVGANAAECHEAAQHNFASLMTGFTKVVYRYTVRIAPEATAHGGGGTMVVLSWRATYEGTGEVQT